MSYASSNKSYGDSKYLLLFDKITATFNKCTTINITFYKYGDNNNNIIFGYLYFLPDAILLTITNNFDNNILKIIN